MSDTYIILGVALGLGILVINQEWYPVDVSVDELKDQLVDHTKAFAIGTATQIWKAAITSKDSAKQAAIQATQAAKDGAAEQTVIFAKKAAKYAHDTKKAADWAATHAKQAASEARDAAGEFAEFAAHDATTAASKAGEAAVLAASIAGEAARYGARKTGEAARYGARKTGEAARYGARKTGEAARYGARKTGEAARYGARKTGEAARYGARKTGEAARKAGEAAGVAARRARVAAQRAAECAMACCEAMYSAFGAALTALYAGYAYTRETIDPRVTEFYTQATAFAESTRNILQSINAPRTEDADVRDRTAEFLRLATEFAQSIKTSTTEAISSLRVGLQQAVENVNAAVARVYERTQTNNVADLVDAESFGSDEDEVFFSDDEDEGRTGAHLPPGHTRVVGGNEQDWLRESAENLDVNIPIEVLFIQYFEHQQERLLEDAFIHNSRTKNNFYIQDPIFFLDLMKHNAKWQQYHEFYLTLYDPENKNKNFTQDEFNYIQDFIMYWQRNTPRKNHEWFRNILQQYMRLT